MEAHASFLKTIHNQSDSSFGNGAREDDRDGMVWAKFFAPKSHFSTSAALRNVIMEALQPSFDQYLWHSEPFQLSERAEIHLTSKNFEQEDDAELAQLSNTLVSVGGTLHFGENIEDEWFLTSLLIPLTKQYPMVITLDDNDGQFLLVEAADHLPEWVTPDKIENRVFLYQGSLHLIPLPSSPSDLFSMPVQLSLPSALSLLLHSTVTTIASEPIQQAIHDRIKRYPDKAIAQSKHMCRCLVPVAIAALLKQVPQIVAPAVSSFYYRSPSDLQHCKNQARFFRIKKEAVAQKRRGNLNPNQQEKRESSKSSESSGVDGWEGKKEEWIWVRIRFTHCLFAQLAQQELPPLPSFILPSLPSFSSPEYRGALLGVKLALGFELLYQLNSSSNGHGVHHPLLVKKKSLSDGEWDVVIQSYPWALDKKWIDFRLRLQRQGYFGEMATPSSSIERQAKISYLQSQRQQGDSSSSFPSSSSPSSSNSPQWDSSQNPAHFIDSILSSFSSPLPLASSLTDTSGLPDDEEEWMVVGPDDVDDLLKKYSTAFSSLSLDDDDLDEGHAGPKKKQKFGEAKATQRPSQDPGASNPDPFSEMTQTLQQFLSKTSDFEGVESFSPSSSSSQPFDSEQFMSILKREIETGGEGTSDDESDDDPIQNEGSEAIFQSVLSQMDAELSESLKAAKTTNDSSSLPGSSLSNLAEGDDQLDFHLVQNILKSMEEQEDGTGPFPNLLSFLGT